MGGMPGAHMRRMRTHRLSRHSLCIALQRLHMCRTLEPHICCAAARAEPLLLPTLPAPPQVLNHCYELLAGCVRSAEDVSAEMKVGQGLHTSFGSISVPGFAAFVAQLPQCPGMKVGRLRLQCSRGSCVSCEGGIAAAVAAVACRWWPRGEGEGARRRRGGNQLPLLLPLASVDLIPPFSGSPPRVLQDVYDQLRGAKNALRKLMGKRVRPALPASKGHAGGCPLLMFATALCLPSC